MSSGSIALAQGKGAMRPRLRLKLQNGRIIEAEHLLARNLMGSTSSRCSGGKLHEIEAMGFTMPYNSKTGWEQ